MPNIINKDLIAPCGMNCGVCKAYLHPKKSCHGCNNAKQNKTKTRTQCYLRMCSKRKSYFCYDCKEFPCDRLKHLDDRYRKKYGMSEIENLEYIREKGIRKFVQKERKRWISKRGIFCVHDRKYYQFAR
jgi:hypothetical protein